MSLSVADFDHRSDSEELNSDDGAAVYAQLKLHTVRGAVCRRAKWPFNTSTLAWEGDGVPQLRCAYLDERPIEDWVSTVVHEQAYAAAYKHHGNGRDGNECSVPHPLVTVFTKSI